MRLYWKKLDEFVPSACGALCVMLKGTLNGFQDEDS
jgi:hypothetical protein